MLSKKTLLITGGAGFIGSAFVRHILKTHADYEVINFDVLSYAGNLDNLLSVQDNPHYTFIQGDICDREAVSRVFKERKPSVVVNFAAETHNDRSIQDPGRFILTDVYGTHVLLEACREHGIERYVQISTDEVYGSIETGSFTEQSPLAPNSPYSASKTGGDGMVRAYFVTHKLPVIITRSSNNYGSYQYPEKFIPLFITNALLDQPLPLYGDGKNVRDWLFVDDNCKGIDWALHHGGVGEVYNIGGGNEWQNIDVANFILDYLGKSRSLIRPVTDRKGHDRRYSLDSTKLEALGWKPETPFEEGLRQTVDWYRDQAWWWEKIRKKQSEFEAYYRKQYAELFR